MSVPAKDKKDKVIEGMARAGGYYINNIDEFVKDYLQLDFLKEFQLDLLTEMNEVNTFLWIAARGMGKSFLIAIFAVARCILYPWTKVVITSGTRGQSINILKKIQTELMPRSTNLTNEIDIKGSKFGGQDAQIMFKNKSIISVATASDNARSGRANILIVDEFRLVKKDTIDTVLKKFLTSRRMPAYSELSEEERRKEYSLEPNKVIYLSSAYFKDHWSYQKMYDNFITMTKNPKAAFVCGLPYQLSIQEGLLFPEDVESDMLESDFSEVKWSMEMEAKWFGSEDGSFFDFDTISKSRHIKYPMLPDKVAELVGSDKRVRIVPKQNGEVRILSIDIALMSSTKHKNDASAVFVNSMIPTKSGRYTCNIVYTNTYEGIRTDDLALMIRKLFDEYECNYIVLDCMGLGLGVFDALARDIVDIDTGEVYPAISCCNNTDMAARCTIPGAEKVIWAIKAGAQFNSDCAFLLREGFRSGRIRLLCTEYDAEEYLSDVKGYNGLSSEEKMEIQMPYIHTTLLIDELTKLLHEESNGKIKVYEKSGMRKDRYSSLSYNYYVAMQLETKLSKRHNINKANQSLGMIKAPRYTGRAVNTSDGGGNASWF